MSGRHHQNSFLSLFFCGLASPFLTAVSFTVSYWTDKYSLRIWRTPAQIDGRGIRKMVQTQLFIQLLSRGSGRVPPTRRSINCAACKPTRTERRPDNDDHYYHDFDDKWASYYEFNTHRFDVTLPLMFLRAPPCLVSGTVLHVRPVGRSR